jgi:hypothetical protein
MGMESVNPGGEPAPDERVEAGEPSDRQKIELLLRLFKERRAVDGREDPLDDEEVLAAAAARMREERAALEAPSAGRHDLRDAA